jgi:Ca-activated chloride channel family protein
MNIASNPSPPLNPSTGGRLVATSGLALPLAGVRVNADARGGLARVTLAQTFKNPHATPLAVVYAFPLPHDAAVSGYSFTVAGKRVVGEVDRRAAARERFEEAILEGKTAALLDQERTSLFTQEIGNVPPGAEVVVELVLDQRLAFLSEGAWEWRFPLAAAPRYLGAPGVVPDAAQVAIDVADSPVAARAAFALTVRDTLGATKPESPSHRVDTAGRDGAAVVSLVERDGAPLDRDIVVRWNVARPYASGSIDVGRPRAEGPHAHAAYGLFTLVPPARERRGAGLPRDLIVLLDTSGSMGGAPLDQARRVVTALVETLTDRDRLELLEFSSSARRWNAGAVHATAAHRKEALSWLASLRASGGTEMRDGIVEALAPLAGESQRQVVLVTDGQIGFEREVVSAILEKLPSGACLHAVGVGSAVNRSLTGSAARAGRGVEVILGLGEDPERGARRIVACTESPLVVDVTLEGSALLASAPARRSALFAASPVLASVKLRPEGGELVARGRTEDGTWEQRVLVPACAPGEGPQAVVALFGREAVEDLEMDRAATGRTDADQAIETLGLEFQIATRLTSWVAVAEEPSVDPLEPLRRVKMPQALPYGMSMEGLGLRSGGVPSAGAMIGGGVAFAAAAPRAAAAGAMPRMRAQGIAPPGTMARSLPSGGMMARVRAAFAGEEKSATLSPSPRRLWGRILKNEQGSLTIEVTVEGEALAWVAGKKATLGWADGSETHTPVKAATHERELASGEVARLILPIDPSDAARIAGLRTITVGDGTIVIEL